MNEINEAMKCTRCGVSEEFEPCDLDGKLMEPTSDWGNDWKCGNCANIQNDSPLKTPLKLP